MWCMRHHRAFALVTILFTCGALAATQTARYFKAEHGVGATYVKLSPDGSYKVIDREHMGIFLTDDGHWKETGAVVTFNPKVQRNPRTKRPRISTMGEP